VEVYNQSNILNVTIINQRYFQSKGLIRRRTKDIFNDHCQAGFDPGGLQRDVTNMLSRNGYTPRCTACWEVLCDSRPSVEMSTVEQKGALLTFYTASW